MKFHPITSTRSSVRRLSLAILLVCTCLRLEAQSPPPDPWSLGLSLGNNVWINDYSTRVVGSGFGATVGYGFSPLFSLAVRTGYEELKSQKPPEGSGIVDEYLKLNAVPFTLLGVFHFMPGDPFSPYAYAGSGILFFNRRDGSNAFIPDIHFRSSLLIPVGIGVEAFPTRQATLTVDVGLNFSGGYTDNLPTGSLDSYVSARIWLTFYPGAEDAADEDEDVLPSHDERALGTDPTNSDSDGDNLKDGDEVRIYHTNPLNKDTDGDDLLDGDEVLRYRTDPNIKDSDGDGLSDGVEVLQTGTNPNNVDSDGDGLIDGDEVMKYHSNPLKVDTDGDLLSDRDEVKLYLTLPSSVDTDGDSLGDGEEVKLYKTNPLVKDTDGGGIDDGTEVRRGTNPLDPSDDVVSSELVLERGKTIVLEGVTFVPGTAKIIPFSEPFLEKAYRALRREEDLVVDIVGHTDGKGSLLENERLSLRRAEAVKKWFVKKGIVERRLNALSRGMREPIDSNETEAGRARNRRVELRVRP